MATKYKPQSPSTIERNRLRKKRRDDIFKAMCLHKNIKVPKGTARKVARRDIEAWKQRRDARRKQERGELPTMQRAISVVAHLEAQEDANK